MKVRSLFISDCHLGCPHFNDEKLLTLISEVECEYLYIVGDFFDGWALKKNFLWKSNYNVILQKILRMSRKGTKVFYTIGNHEHFLENYTGLSLGDNILITREIVHETKRGKKLLVLHGDQFDGFITKYKWLQQIGAVIYDYSLCLNKIFRLTKFSFSHFLKQHAKEAIKYINNYEDLVADHCRANGYDGILCGHIHKPENKTINGISYYNCGDFVEPNHNSYFVETLEGEMELRFLN